MKSPPWLNKAFAFARLMRLDRPIGNFLLLWPTLAALWIAAEGFPPPGILAVFVAGVFVMRAAGCVINDYADRNFDGHVERTTARPLATGELKPREAIAAFVVLGLVALALVLQLNPLTIKLSVVGILLAIVYPFSKRYTYLPQVVLGAAFGWAVPMAFAAVTGEIPQTAWLLFIATVLFATVYDTEYAMVDRPDDLKVGIKSTAVLFGDADRAILGVLMLLLLACWALVGHKAALGWVYYLGLFAAALSFAFQQYLIRDRDRQACFRAFLSNNWTGAYVFLGVVLHYAYLPPV